MTWYDVVIKHASANSAVDLKNQILNDGLIQGQDFEWRYQQSVWDNMTGVSPSYVKFSFRDQAMATFYRLKWQ